MKNLVVAFSFSLLALPLAAQQLVVVNGGIWGGGNDTNFGLYHVANQQFTPIDTLGTSSIQDALIEANQYLYLAAGDSLFKYDLSTQTQVAAASFGGVSAIKLAIYNDYLLAGNWYGQSSDNLRIFDKNDLSFVSSIPEIVQGATDLAIVGDTLYIRQNINDFSSNYTDTLGYLSVVNLQNLTWLRNDTLATQGEDLGRVWVSGDTVLYSFNSVSGTISSYDLNNGDRNTLAANADLRLNYYGNTIFNYNDKLYIPLADGLTGYDPANQTADAAAIVDLGGAEGQAWAMDTQNGLIFRSTIYYSNQSANMGHIFNMNGDSIGAFPVGAAPEVLAVWYDNLLNAVEMPMNTVSLAVFPNPASDYVSIQTPDFQTADVFVQDALGRVIYWQKNADLAQTINTKNWISGVYTVTIINNNRKMSLPLVVGH